MCTGICRYRMALGTVQSLPATHYTVTTHSSIQTRFKCHTSVMVPSVKWGHLHFQLLTMKRVGRMFEFYVVLYSCVLVLVCNYNWIVFPKRVYVYHNPPRQYNISNVDVFRIYRDHVYIYAHNTYLTFNNKLLPLPLPPLPSPPGRYVMLPD